MEQESRMNICLTDKSMGIGRVKIQDAKFFPEVPSYYKLIDMTVYHLLAKDADDYIKKYEWNGLSIIVSVGLYNNKEWLHVSFARKSRIPDYNDIQRVRRDFIGEDKKCFMVFPKEENYVNIHKYCLHLWYSEDADIPDFEVEIPGIGKSI